jgi:AcrR family transcriptional regulator
MRQSIETSPEKLLHKPENLSPHVQRKREERKQVIINKAEEIIVDEGLGALTIHQLAKSLDYAPGALYRYFESKEALIAELSCRAINRIHAQLRLVEAEAPVGIDDLQVLCIGRLLKSAAMYMQLSQSDPAAYRLLSSLLGDPEHLLEEKEATRVHNATAPVLLSFAKLIQAAELSSAIRAGPAAERAVAFWAGLQGIVQLRKLVRRSSSLQAMLEPESTAHQFGQDLLRGWGANDKTITAADEAFIRTKN